MSKSQWMREFVRRLGNTYLVQSCLSVSSLSVSVTKIFEQCTIRIWSRRETHPSSWNIQTSASTKYLLNIKTTRLSPSRLNLREISFSPDAAKTKWYPLSFYLKHNCQNIFSLSFPCLLLSRWFEGQVLVKPTKVVGVLKENIFNWEKKRIFS